MGRIFLSPYILQNKLNIDIDKTDSFIRLYKRSTDIIRAVPSYNNTPWFSDVSIVMEITDTTTYVTDHGIYFGKVLLLGEIFVNNLHNITFAMVKWYDYCEQDNEDLEICGCPRLKLLKDYDIVPLDSIEQAVHIIPRFHKKNQFLVNRNMF
ncbi:unnamed protein product [Rhizophagus irregularis]|nr:unnamed protein product [Rhizophagus irregularis]